MCVDRYMLKSVSRKKMFLGEDSLEQTLSHVLGNGLGFDLKISFYRYQSHQCAWVN